ncbi:MAG: cyanophycin synthetase [Myxococcota bacterium]
MSDTAAWEALFARRTFGVRLGLSIVQGVFEALGRPGQGTPAIHIVGTNGKGSTAALMEHALRSRGWRTGLYTSPHLHRVGERVRLDGEPVSDERLERHVDRVLATEPGLSLERPLSFFEVLTLAALDLMAQAPVDIAIVEAGLGGRLDATRVVDARAVAVASIARDHEAMLGSTLTAIATEKAAVLRRGVPTFSAAQDPEAAAVLERRATEVGSELHWVSPLPEAPRGLPGVHQRANAAVALATAQVFEPTLTAADLDGVTWPGRLEPMATGGGTLVFDVAHNPAGIRAMVDAVRQGAVAMPGLVVFGCQADKDAAAMVETLAELGQQRWWVNPTPTDVPPSLPSEHWPRRFEAALDPALVDGIAAHLARGETVLVCGSHRVVGSLRGWARGADRPPEPSDPRPTG